MDLGLTQDALREPPQPAGLFRRVCAAAIDDAILGAIGLAIAFLFADPLVPFGAAGRLIGAVIALAYFGLLGGPAGDGQTVGKHIMRIRVVDASGASLPVGRAFLRAGLLGLPWFLNGLPLRATFMLTPVAGPAVEAVISVAVFGLGGALLVTLLFNRATRQGLHDLAVGSFVVMEGARRPVASARASRRVTGAALAWLGVVVVLATGWAAFTIVRGLPPAFDVPVGVARGVEAVPDVLSAGVQSRTMYGPGGRNWTELVVTARTARAHESIQPAIARAILAVPGADAHDVFRIQVRHGADVGIAHWTYTRDDVRTPAEWRLEAAPR
jgi:uncharacterized RDD family membrane protein YckC